MYFFTKNIKWIMIVAGLLTCSMILSVFAPQTALINMFGEALSEPLAQVIVRSWGFLIFLIGALLIIGAIYPVHRNLAIFLTTISKTVFISIIVVYGPQYISASLSTIILDTIITCIFVVYLVQVNVLRNK